ncbi:similar to glucose-methanol-choline oxidoreductase:GMC oxidoreductase [Plenodomus lingam JN3]|uniref:Similar to glucose-methanol-choline oxidoreductase:GMC oxidoreductase n=1 Tax=Leptosphaeria maculans (strain JN3 / isolate v23.1.3 / race Av1-4-5-6-7-8) TaxID=985895 RepID=E4ZI25_LEPMJ|nr:similar to glucose-methanol-choline oxidoreductase:GMC oxidoreductase [Plenodomus lingam JN3]CBX91168.1 similar to glucose-methanol-choline oxidoreductase:GMC oxidoreductase [Plenodomus lingam JN3]
MLFRQLFGSLAAFTSLATAVDLTGYEYVVVGSGAGGGPLAARLALAGHKTLLIEAGDDQGANINYTVPSFNARVSEDPNLAWNFFVRHYADEARQARDFKTTYTLPDGSEYTGLNPPEGAEMKGVLYPRTGTLGGCTSHNALIAVYPHQSDFDHVASITGDDSWAASNMRKYFEKLEKNQYLLPGAEGHGRKGWLGTAYAPIDFVLADPQLVSMISGAAFALGNETNAVVNLGTLIAGDANSASPERDSKPGLFQIPISTTDGKRTGAREFVLAVRDATFNNGTKRYPLDIRLNCHVTKVTFDQTVTPPRATGVEFLDGQYLYKASPKSKGASGTPGSATASREVIVAGGTYNSPQLLKLSGVGPADELEKFDIPVVVDLPGVGTNLQDHYETNVQGKAPHNFSSLAGCTFGESTPDRCLDRWQKKTVLGNRGIYSSPGLGVNMFYKSSATARDEFDVFVFGGPVNFRGYFPGYSINATHDHDWFTWAILKAHPRNTAGTVTLRSADPLDMPDITYNYFDTGNGDFQKDITAITEAINLARSAIKRQLVPIDEILPGPSVTSQADIADYIKDPTWGPHPSSPCPMGADPDPRAVLDSRFRVRGTAGLRVVDASVFPRIPGTFTAVSTYMVAEKAADVILSEVE